MTDQTEKQLIKMLSRAPRLIIIIRCLRFKQISYMYLGLCTQNDDNIRDVP